MKLEKLSAIAETTSSVAILVTLVFLTVQTSQTTEAMNTQSRQSVLSSAQAELFLMVEHPDLVTSVTKSDPLTREDNVRLDAFLTAVFRAREFSWLQFRSGTIDEAQWNTELAVNRSLFSAPRVRLWWTELGRTYVSPEFAEFLDGLQSELPASRNDWERQATWSNP